jgi:hypothetical protein
MKIKKKIKKDPKKIELKLIEFIIKTGGPSYEFEITL